MQHLVITPRWTPPPPPDERSQRDFAATVGSTDCTLGKPNARCLTCTTYHAWSVRRLLERQYQTADHKWHDVARDFVSQ